MQPPDFYEKELKQLIFSRMVIVFCKNMAPPSWSADILLKIIFYIKDLSVRLFILAVLSLYILIELPYYLIKIIL